MRTASQNRGSVLERSPAMKKSAKEPLSYRFKPVRLGLRLNSKITPPCCFTCTGKPAAGYIWAEVPMTRRASQVETSSWISSMERTASPKSTTFGLSGKLQSSQPGTREESR